MTAPVRAPGRFTLQIPDSWIDYDLGNRDFTREQAALRSQAPTPAARAAVDDLFRQVRKLVRSARKQGAMSAAGLIARDETEGLLMAFVSVFGAAVPDGAELSLTDIAAQLSRPAGPEGYGDRTVGSAELPGIGVVARITGTEVVALTDTESAVMLAMHTIIPLPGEPGMFLVVTGVSPNLPLAEAMFDLFDAITGTFRFV
ncbi:hypothetical protein [Actinoplanes sp. L3-i22]|uniref:hypothetical protein n=1 Tax=Actinoplanes sp. L3-i22 TaxID=2836373 RepID=UPI001C77E687|nr:hypothetical protein [Actinoplanes sp. L3-i22]BCY07223.1 hypothetical protein L3i22_023110 [Actinoplanes sp. L3-i22]